MLVVERLKEIVNEINSKLKGSYLNRIECLNEYDYIFKFSYGKEKTIFISLNLNNPFVALVNKKYSFSSTSSFYQRIKSKLLNACLINAYVLNEDNILVLEFLKVTDTYDKIHYSLVFEIFKSNSNLILLNENKIEDAFRFKGIDTHHPIMRNMTYTPPQITPFKKEVKEKDVLNETKYIENLEKNYLASKYKIVAVELKRKLKSLHKKLEKIKEDQKEAYTRLDYKNYADYLLTILNEVNRGDSYFLYSDKKIKINETYSPTENLNQLYKIYKKAKLTIISTNEYIDKTVDEINYLDSVIASLNYLNEDDYIELINELIEKKLLKQKSQKKNKNQKNATHPYFIIFKGIRIGFGKNSKQNANLTFNLAKKDNYFIHIKNNHGNHVIIFDSNPIDEVIQFALEFTLFLSNQKDGELIYALVKTLRKGSEEGLVKLGPYESYTIKSLHYDFDEIIKGSSRF